METKFSIVICLKNASHHDGTNNIDRFVSIGMPTFEKFLDKASVAEFIVITPKEEAGMIDARLVKAFPEWSWKVYHDSQLLHEALDAGWARQQTAKLCIAQLIKTDHYLIIDDDTYLTRPFSYKSLFGSDDKLILNKITIDFPFFFLWSNQLLDFDFDKVQDFPYVMGITPEIFHTKTVRDLVKFLVDKYGSQKRWQLKLQSNKFTEYGLYWIWLIKNDLVQSLYTNEDAPIYAYAVTDETHDLAQYIEKAFEPAGKHYFSFVQSSLPHKINYIADIVAKYI